jgi:hypothetical protein
MIENAVPLTTVIIQNIPKRYTQHELAQELEQLGFFVGTAIDFLYLPVEKGWRSNMGYAFVNCVDQSWAHHFLQTLDGYRFARHQRKFAKLPMNATGSWAHIQGLEANIQHHAHVAKIRQHWPVIVGPAM